MRDILTQGLSQWGLDGSRVPQLEHFAALLLEKNQVMNLTRITEPDDVARLHLLDSAALLTVADFAGKRVVDVGTGAGFPGMPMKLLCDDFDLTLLDSLGKRVEWLDETCRTLGLSRVSCVHARAEEFAETEREGFDFAVSRAVAALPVLCELALPLVKVGGAFLAMKSVDCDAELSDATHAIDLLGGRLARTVDYHIPTCEVVHRVLVIEKIAPTPAKYPRAFAKIKKSPL